jgi:hypothetical protein
MLYVVCGGGAVLGQGGYVGVACMHAPIHRWPLV